MGNPELLTDFAQVTLGAALVLHHTRAADHSQICNLGKIGQNLVLDSISKISVLLVVTPAFEWKYGDTFLRNLRLKNRRRLRNESAYWFDRWPEQKERNSDSKRTNDRKDCSNQCPTAF